MPAAPDLASPLIKLADIAPLTPLLFDPGVNDILINGAQGVFIERAGKLLPTDIKLGGEAEVRQLADAIAREAGRPIDPARPMLDTRLADGSRVNIICPPMAVDGTTISIRRFTQKGLTLDDMARQGNISPELAEFMKIIGRCRLNILISGGTGAGKTTLLNALSQFAGDDERIVTIEDTAELKLQKPHVVRLETIPVPVGGAQEAAVTTRDLVRNSLRMRPDRIIVGEVRGEEAFDMLQAMNTGHEGSLATIHANHPRDALSRLENMIGMAGMNMPLRAVRGQIASALHLIIQISRMADGLRRVTHVSEIHGMEGDIITIQELVHFTDKGRWQWAGITPRFHRRVEYWGEGERFARLFSGGRR